MRHAPLVVLALLVAGAAEAAADAGDLTTSEPIALPPGARVEGASTALFCDDLGTDDAIHLVAPGALVERHERTRLAAGPVAPYVEHATSTYALTSLELRVTRADGWLGAGGPDAMVALAPGASLTLAPRGQERVGNWHGSDPDADALPAFSRHVDAHLSATHAVAGSLSGSMDLKLYGSTVTLAARENTTTIRTGATSTSGLVEDTWVVIHLESASGRIEVREPCALALSRASVTATGAWSVERAQGHLAADGARRTLDGEHVRLDGAVEATLAIVPDAPRPTARVIFAGNIRLASADGALLDRPVGAWPAWIFGVALAAALGTATLAHRRRREPPLTLEECTDLADAAAEAGRYANALLWTRRARALAPDSARLRMDEAWFLWETGEVEQALSAAEAAASAGDAEITFAAALLFSKADEPTRARIHLLGALAASPCLALDATHEPSFSALRNDPRVALAIDQALRHCD